LRAQRATLEAAEVRVSGIAIVEDDY